MGNTPMAGAGGAGAGATGGGGGPLVAAGGLGGAAMTPADWDVPTMVESGNIAMLNLLLTSSQLRQHLHALSHDHWYKLMDVLVERVKELSLPAKCGLVEHLNVDCELGHEECVLFSEVMLCTEGADLTLLKCHIEKTGEVKDLFSLVYDRLPKHFARQLITHFHEHRLALANPRATSICEPDAQTFAVLGLGHTQSDSITDLEAVPPKALERADTGPAALGCDVAPTTTGAAEALPDTELVAVSDVPVIVDTPEPLVADEVDPAIDQDAVLALAAAAAAAAAGESIDAPTASSESNSELVTPTAGAEGRVEPSILVEAPSTMSAVSEAEESTPVALGPSSPESQDGTAPVQARAIGSRIAPIKVLCDVDDTIACSFYDFSFPRGICYPGCTAFVQAMKACEWDSALAGNLVILTARIAPLKSMTYRKLCQWGTGMDTVLLTGSAVDWTSNSAMARRKLRNFLRYSCLFPEYRYVWIGDSGQGDVELGLHMLQNGERDAIAAELGIPSDRRIVPSAIFIHDIVRRTGEHKLGPLARRDLAAHGVFVFDSYAEAAAIACELELIPPAAAAEVISICHKEFTSISFPSHAMYDARKAELTKGSQRLAQYLRAQRHLAASAADAKDTSVWL